MLFAIYAYENTYGGLHGINERYVGNHRDLAEAEEMAIEASRILMSSNEDIMKILEDKVKNAGYEYGSDKYKEYLEACIEDNIIYYIWDIKRGLDKTIEEMDKEFNSDPWTFIEKYCSGNENYQI